MTAGPLTPEDLERLTSDSWLEAAEGSVRHDAPRDVVASDCLVLVSVVRSLRAALRSVMAEMDALAKWRAEARREWERFLRAPTDAESDEGSKALDRLMEATRLAGWKPIDQ